MCLLGRSQYASEKSCTPVEIEREREGSHDCHMMDLGGLSSFCIWVEGLCVVVWWGAKVGKGLALGLFFVFYSYRHVFHDQ